MRVTLIAILTLLANGPALAGPGAAPVSVKNLGSTELACRVLLAHWYMLEFQAQASGGELELPLRYDSSTGTVSILNTRNAEMAVEGITCGRAGNVWADGTAIQFPSLAERATHHPVEVDCDAGPPASCDVHNSN